MALEAGTRLGPYSVTEQIGAGGMGEVYRARDTKLDRDVALKILPEDFASDPERLARFQREAKVLASLNHPNIAQIHGLEDSTETLALVLELVPGPTLQDRIAKGPIPLDEALPIARQIAEALEAAHEQGIIHRDLKPANVKVKDDGTVKVLDFGLAKALQPELSDAEAANSPTMTMTAAATKMGVIMGTAAYMSPEQAKGRQVDKRADIWAFGVVLFEMLTGRQAFGGTDISETLASVLKTDLDLAALPAGTPRNVRRVLSRCIQKDRTRRSRDIGDVRLDLSDSDDEAAGAAAEALVAPVAAVQSALWQRPVPAALAALALIVLGGLAVWSTTRPAPAPVTRTSIVLPRTQAAGTEFPVVAVSPTGSHVVYVADAQLYLRAMDESQAVPLAGTEGSSPMFPFFSPDGQWIGFFSQRDSALQKVSRSGGSPVTLTAVQRVYGGSWADDDTIITIIFAEARQPGDEPIVPRLLRVPAAGGTPEVLRSVDGMKDAVTPNSGPTLGYPQLLPGGRALLYTVGIALDWGQAQIVAERLATGERKVVVERGTDARYLESGHLIYRLDDTLLAVPFDVDRLEVTGGAVPVIEGVGSALRGGATHLDVSSSGTLVYLAGAGRGFSFVWVDRDGREEALAAPLREYAFPRISPDGTRVAVDVRDLDGDIWIWSFEGETLTRLTFEPAGDTFPVWTPDSQRVVYTSGVPANLYWRAADGTGTAERLLESPIRHAPHTISPDGSRLVFYQGGALVGFDLYVMTLDDERRVEPLIVTEFNERNAEISPDGRWLAYQSDASGRLEIYVQPFPDVDSGRWQISTDGGARALWGPDGRELFFMTNDGVMGVTVEVDAGSGFRHGTPELIVEGRYVGTSTAVLAQNRTYDISPDGQRFLMLTEGRNASGDDPFAGLTQIHVVQNWTQELLERVPVP